jgi:hypothetical protein
MSDHIADVSKMVDENPGVQGLAQLGRNAIERVAQLEAEIVRLTGCLERANAQAEHFEREWYLRGDVLDTAEYWLGSLLAVIHRDGGHYEAEHGTARAADDAIAAVHVLRGSLEGYVEANRYMKGELDDALEDARKYAEAQGEIARLTDANRHQDEMIGEQATQIARLREAMAIIAHPVNIGKLYHMDAVTQARAALAQVAEVPNG